MDNLDKIINDLKELNPASWKYEHSYQNEMEWTESISAPYKDKEAVLQRYVTTPMARTQSGIQLRIIKDKATIFESHAPLLPEARNEDLTLLRKLEDAFSSIRKSMPKAQ